MNWTTISTLLLTLISAPLLQAADKTETAILAGGCFWCVEADFEKLNGVKEAISGYTGGHTDNPTYKQVGKGGTGHIEAVKVIYDPSVISYEKILDFYWRHIDPTRDDGQFCDGGYAYKPAIFYNEKQKDTAETSRKNIIENKPFSDSIKVALLPASEFFDAEEYHQDYYKKSPLKYRYYRHGCGRDKRIKQLWGKR